MIGLKDFQIVRAGQYAALKCVRCVADVGWLMGGDDLGQLVGAAVRHAEEHHKGDTWQPHDMLREEARPL